VQLGIGLKIVLSFPFFGAAACVIMCVRALLTGEMKVGGGRSRVRSITRVANPIQFWIQIVSFVGVAGFLTLLGLFLFDLGPAWFHNAMLGDTRNRPRG
jgi:hypothetical protein